MQADQVAARATRPATCEHHTTRPFDPFLRATFELGRRYERAALEFWRSLDVDPDGRGSEASRTTDGA